MNTVEIFFSPTGGTEKAAHIIAKQWSDNTVKIDLSDSKTNFSGVVIDKDDQVIVAMPSFGGRAPAVTIERLKKIPGNGAKCTLVCVYGNRAYEDKGITVTSSSVHNIEITSEAASKGKMLKKAAEFFKVSEEDVVVFGDGENDESMFWEFGHSRAVKNAVPNICFLAEKIIDSNRNNGVAKEINYIRRYLICHSLRKKHRKNL